MPDYDGVTLDELRVDLAACFRMVEHLGWSDLIFTHMSARIPDTSEYL